MLVMNHWMSIRYIITECPFKFHFDRPIVAWLHQPCVAFLAPPINRQELKCLTVTVCIQFSHAAVAVVNAWFQATRNLVQRLCMETIVYYYSRVIIIKYISIFAACTHCFQLLGENERWQNILMIASHHGKNWFLLYILFNGVKQSCSASTHRH